jgi:hypothetical protein
MALTLGEITNISNTGGSSGGPDIAVSDEGAVMLVWADDDPGQQDIFYTNSTDNGETFSTNVNLSNDGSFSNPPRIALSGNNIYVVWFDADDGEVYFIKDIINGDGTVTFGIRTNLSNNLGISANPRVSTSGSGVYVAWEDDIDGSGITDIFYTNSTDNGENFSTPVNLSNNEGLSQSPQIAVSDADNVYVAWQDDTINPGIEQAVLVRVSTDSGISFGNVTTMNSPAGFGSNPRIVPYGADDLYLVWNDPNPDYDVFFSKGTVNIADGTIDFAIPINVSNNTGFSFESQLAISGSGIIYVAWLDDIDTSPFNQIYVSDSTDNGETFSLPVAISSDANVMPSPLLSILPDNQEDLFVLWQDDNIGSGDIFIAEITNSGLTVGAPINLSSNEGSSISARMVAFEDRLYVTWKDTSSGNDEILFMALSTSPEVSPTIAIQSPDPGFIVKWGETIHAAGTTNGVPTDSITIDWGDGSSTPDITLNGSTWGPVPHPYDSAAVGTRHIVARLLDSEGNERVASDPVTIDVVKHATSISVDISPNVVKAGGNITAEGILTDVDDNVGIAGATILFDGTASAGLGPTQPDADGFYSIEGSSPNSTNTLWNVRANFAGNSIYEPSSSLLSTFDTASLSAAQFTIPIGKPSVVELTGFNASITLESVTAEGTIYVSTCETPDSSRYLSIDLCFVVSATDDLVPNSFAHLTVSYKGKAWPEEHTAEEIDIFHEVPAGFIDITESRDVNQQTITGMTANFSKFVVGIALHDLPQEGAIRKQVFVGQNQELVFNELQPRTITLDQSEYSVGSTVVLTIQDDTANQDDSAVETIEANATSSTDTEGIKIMLSETGTGSGIFLGSFVVDDVSSSDEDDILRAEDGDIITTSYFSPARAPFKVIFDEVIESGMAEITQFTVDQRPEVNIHDFDAIGDAYELRLIDAQLSPESEITVIMSYVNVNLEDDEIISTDLFSLLQFDPESIASGKYGWLDMTTGMDSSQKTVTGTTSSTGNFTIGHDYRVGEPGGGGGGLPRPGTGVVLDGIAGLGAISNNDRHGSGGGGGGGNRVVVVTKQPNPAIDTVETLPESYFAENPLEKIQVNDAGFMNADGNEISEASVGQELSITSTLSNHQQGQQRYYFIVLIIDEDGFAVDIAWQEGTVESGQVADLSISWMPEGDGNYTVKLFVWDGFENPLPLSNMMINHINVV